MIEPGRLRAENTGMTIKKGHKVRAKGGKHKGEVGKVNRDMGTHHVFEVLFPSGPSYQPAANIDPAEPDADDTPTPAPSAAPSAAAWEKTMEKIVDAAKK
jgi:hypothetical protein